MTINLKTYPGLFSTDHTDTIFHMLIIDCGFTVKKKKTVSLHAIIIKDIIRNAWQTLLVSVSLF